MSVQISAKCEGLYCDEYETRYVALDDTVWDFVSYLLDALGWREVDGKLACSLGCAAMLEVTP